ncbi:MAG TPA: sulfotransferase [Solirubrobacterales bacterium]|nr:sulfotransferase [Solirubrobacterales bacterium]
MKARREMLRTFAGYRSRRRAIKRAETAPPPAPFVVGATRSGTTLLRLMLDAHPDIAIPSETHFIPDLIKAREKHAASPERMLEMLTSHRRWGDFHIEPDELAARWAALPELTGPAAVREFFKVYGEKQGGPPRWGDKTPGYVKKMREIQEFLPEARFIHLIRDGRDVALSILKQSFGPETVEAAADRWRGRVLRGRAQRPYLGFYMEVKFEDLVLDTEGQLRRICEFIELDFHPAMLGYHERAEERLKEKARELPRGKGRDPQSAERRLKSHEKTFEPPKPEMVGGYRKKMDPADQATYEALAGDLLVDLGYDVSDPGGRKGTEVHEPRRGPRLPRPLRRALTVAGHATGIRPPAEPRDPAPFVVGAARSGTTLLRAMLDAHSEVTMVSETGFVPKLAETIRSEPVTAERVVKVMAAAKPLEDLGLSEAEVRAKIEALDDLKAAAVLRELYETIAANAGTARWGDETPAYLKRMRRIQRALNESHFIHVIRDGRDTAAAKPGELDPGKALTIGQRWHKKVTSGRQQEHLIEHYLEVRYEELLTNPRTVLERVCEFLELDFEESMLEAPERAEIEAELGPAGMWRDGGLSAEDAEAFAEVAGELLDELGYGRA